MEDCCLAIVTGGAKGLGFAITSALLDDGAKVCFLDMSKEDGLKAQKTLDEKYGNGKATFLHCDVSNKEQLKNAFLEGKSRMGGLNVVCNNAGVYFLADERNHFEEMISVNLCGVVHGCMLAIELMGTGYGGNGGVIINTASIIGLPPFRPLAIVYCSTKAAVIHYTKCLSLLSLSENGVRTNCICPGGVSTELGNKAISELKETKSYGTTSFPMSESEYRATFVEPSVIARETMKLIKDESMNGQTLVITKASGSYFHNL